MTNSNTPKKTATKKAISRRDFLKLSGAAAGAATSMAMPKISFPTFIRQTKMELNLLTWFWKELGRGDAWRMMIKKFHEEQSDIHINETGYGENDYFTQILIQAKSGKIDGDMFTATPDVFLRLQKAGFTTPLEDVVKNAGVTLSKAQDMLRDKDGAVNGLDIVTVRFGLVYNKAMFDKVGIGEPKDIDDWVAGVKALTDKANNVYGVFSPHVASDPFTTWFTLQQWPVIYDGVWAKGQTPLLTSEPVINGLKLFKTMFDYMPQGTDAATATRLFGTSQIAQELVVSAAVNQWKTVAEDPDLYSKLRSAKPFWPGGKGITRIHPICVNSGASAESQAASKVFLSWLYKKENYQQLLEGCLDVIPAIEGGIRPEYRATLTWADGYDATNAITVPETLGDFVLFNDEFGQVVVPHFQEVLAGGTSVEDAMAAAQTEAEDLASRVFAT